MEWKLRRMQNFVKNFFLQKFFFVFFLFFKFIIKN